MVRKTTEKEQFVRNNCDIKNCVGGIDYWAIMATANEDDCDSHGYIRRGGRRLALCANHAMVYWNMIRVSADIPSQWNDNEVKRELKDLEEKQES